MGDRLGLRADLYGAIAAAEPFARKRRRLFERGVVTAVMGDQADVRVGFDSKGGALIMEAVPIISGYAPVVGGWVKIDYEAGHSGAPFIVGPSLSDEETVDPSDLTAHRNDAGEPHSAAAYTKVSTYSSHVASANAHHPMQHTLVGSSHTVSGATVGEVLRATATTSIALGKLTDTNVSSLLADRISGDKLVYALREAESVFDKALQSYLTSFGNISIETSVKNAVFWSSGGTASGLYRQTSWQPNLKNWHLVVGGSFANNVATTSVVKLQVTNASDVVFYEASLEYDNENLEWDFVTRRRTGGVLVEMARNNNIGAPVAGRPFFFEFRICRLVQAVYMSSVTLHLLDRSVWSSIVHPGGELSDVIGDAVNVRFKFVFSDSGATVRYFRLWSFGLSDGVWRS